MIEIGASIGISLYPQHSSDQQYLMESADLALYRAKMSCEGNFVMVTADMKNISRLRRALEDELRQAFDQREFELSISRNL